jgi:hypothetical protein
MVEIVVGYFKEMFTLGVPRGVETVVETMDKIVSDDMIQSLLRCFTADEIQRALF